jgi:hypothetical protein
MAWGSPLDSTGTGSGGLLTGVELADNTSTAFSAGEGANDYVVMTTTNGAEKVTVVKDLHLTTPSAVFVNTISEETAASGVTIDGLRIKDTRLQPTGGTGVNGITIPDNLANAFDVVEGGNNYLSFTTTNAAERVTISKDAHFAATLFVNTISEETNNTGITIDGLLIKDFGIDVSALGTGVSSLVIGDNLAQAWSVKEGSNVYMGFVTTNGSERVAVTKRLTTTDAVSSGTARVVGGVANASAAASTAITGVTEVITNFDTTYTIPPDTFKVGTVVRIRATGKNTAITTTETYVLTVRAGSTALCATPSIAASGSGVANNVFYIDFEFICRATGASGTVVGYGPCLAGVINSTPSRHYLLATGSGATSTATLDTTGSLVLAISNTWQGTATDSNSNRLDSFTVEVIG